MKKINLAIFLSGTGTNFLSLSKACLDPDYPAQIKLVISDRECIGYKLSKKLKYKTILIKHLNNAFDFEKKATHLLKKNHVDLICLAGFMKILSPEFVNNWKNKILNIHPSILPLFPGLGTHKKAIASGMKIHGSTVHVVDENLDSGPIIGQCAINIKSKDNKNTKRNSTLIIACSTSSERYPYSFSTLMPTGSLASRKVPEPANT